MDSQVHNAVKEGYQGVILFLIQMKGPKIFRLNWAMDKDFSEAVNLASKKGVKILAHDSIVNENTISIGKPIEVDFITK